jgi:antitoxin (DNA-binding transcriptional repressor) of toxin-antitoxin stability system
VNVGVRELKQHLSAYMRRVANGETLQVTERGVPVAVISLVIGSDPLARGIEEGWVRPPVATGPADHHPREPGSRRVLDALGEDREA